MNGGDWTRKEVEATVEDYLSMLASELAGTAYNKAAHRRALLPKLNGRSEASVEFKHANISAILQEAGMPAIVGYKPRSNYQSLLAEVIADKLEQRTQLQQLAAADADRPIVPPEVEDILSSETSPPRREPRPQGVAEPRLPTVRLTTNYIEREARNQSLGAAGELFVIEYERTRLVRSGQERLAANIEHTSKVRGDYEGYDILSFEESGAPRLIEVKTTKYGIDTPFYASRNEISVSERNSDQYNVYRLFEFRNAPRFFRLSGAIPATCNLSPITYLASAR